MFPFKEMQNQNPNIRLDVLEKYCRKKIISNTNEVVREDAGIQILLREFQDKIFQWFGMDGMRRPFVLKLPEKDLEDDPD
jgi:hypothetical protein